MAGGNDPLWHLTNDVNKPEQREGRWPSVGPAEEKERAGERGREANYSAHNTPRLARNYFLHCGEASRSMDDIRPPPELKVGWVVQVGGR